MKPTTAALLAAIAFAAGVALTLAIAERLTDRTVSRLAACEADRVHAEEWLDRAVGKALDCADHLELATATAEEFRSRLATSAQSIPCRLAE